MRQRAPADRLRDGHMDSNNLAMGGSCDAEAAFDTLRGNLKERCEHFANAIAKLDQTLMTKRQREVADLRSAGLSFAAIGAQIGISAARARQIAARLLSRARLEARFVRRSRNRPHFS